MAGDEVFRIEDMRFEGPNLNLPSPPEDLAYEDYEDWRALALLDANGVAATEEGVLGALRARTDVVLAAAAHAAGSLGLGAAAPQLHEVADGPDDYAGVEAAYALARLGEDERGRALLHAALPRPLGPYLSPVLAAGHLARLGDPSGFGVVREGLGSDLLAVKMLACKQLAFFLPFQSAEVDARALLEQALADPDPEVSRQARVQLPRG